MNQTERAILTLIKAEMKSPSATWDTVLRLTHLIREIESGAYLHRKPEKINAPHGA